MARRSRAGAMTGRSDFGGGRRTNRPLHNPNRPSAGNRSTNLLPKCSLLRLVPYPVPGRLQRKIRVVLQRVREVVRGCVAVHKENWRNESLTVLVQLHWVNGGSAAREVPMVIVIKPEGRRFVHQDEARWIGRPAFLFARQVVALIGRRLDGSIQERSV